MRLPRLPYLDRPAAGGGLALTAIAGRVPPGSFAFVMATGIVSIAAARAGPLPIAELLFAANLVAFPALCLLFVVRLWQRPVLLLGDLRHHQRGPALLTTVAATCVLGGQVSLLTGHSAVVGALWIVGGALWLGLIYALFAAMTARPVKPAFDHGVDGGWLLVVVATEALAILGTDAARVVPLPQSALLVSLCLFLLGGLFYLMLLTLIVYRWLFLPMAPDQLAPSYWINMGAAAITALAGARLLPPIAADPALAAAQRFLFTATVLCWSMATWWIPLLAAMTLWRHRARPLDYRLENWSIVFPLGMYTTATWNLSHALGLPLLAFIPRLFVWIAIAAWCLTFAGMLRQLGRSWHGGSGG